MKKIGLMMLVIFLASCSKNIETPNGTVINYVIKGGDEGLPDVSLVGLYNIRYTTEGGALILETNPTNLKAIKIDPLSNDQGELIEVLKLLKIGDSVTFEVVASNLYEKSFGNPRPDSIPLDSKIQFQIAYKKQMTDEEYYEMANKKAEEEANNRFIFEKEMISDFLKENNIDAQETETGLMYVITKEGSGPNAEAGQMVMVNYAGKLISGEYFDTSIEEIAKNQNIFQAGRNYEPFTFTLGKGQVIKGWDEGIALLNKGAKATLFIPSKLGYGNRRAGTVIKPNSVLIFDVELVGFK